MMVTAAALVTPISTASLVSVAAESDNVNPNALNFAMQARVTLLLMV